MSSMPAFGVNIKYKLLYYPGVLKIKGDYRVLSYDDNLIIIKCGNENICISGEKIGISMLAVNEVHICGKISGVVFE
ncbi:MAG: YabP/YqfC family sporulation protein [Clostridia bacterium]|nr:YabP/YqfC family sporulation protein [Clostridia bacterium]